MNTSIGYICFVAEAVINLRWVSRAAKTLPTSVSSDGLVTRSTLGTRPRFGANARGLV